MKVIRNHSAKEATPYLRRWASVMLLDGMNPQETPVLDLACGLGRNSQYLRGLGFSNITALDQETSYSHARIWHAADQIPVVSNYIGLILCQYLWMFLDDDERESTMLGMHRVSKPTCVLVFEAEDVKSGRLATANSFTKKFFSLSPREWKVIHMTQKRCILQRSKNG